MVGVKAASRRQRQPAFPHRGALEDGRWHGEKEPCGHQAGDDERVYSEEGRAPPREDSDVKTDC